MNDLPTTATGTLRLLPESKEQIKTFLNLIRDEVLSGFIDPLAFEIRMKALELTVDAIRKDPEIKAAVMKEAEKYGTKTFKFNGARITMKEAGVKYDYSQCNCEDWHFHNRAVENHKTSMKQLESMLKVLKPDGMADPTTGEVMFPPSKTSTSIISIEID